MGGWEDGRKTIEEQIGWNEIVTANLPNLNNDIVFVDCHYGSEVAM